MMGNKKLSTIRKELKAVLAATGDEPIRWLEDRISAAKRQGDGVEVLESVKRVLERGGQKKAPKRGIGTKKSTGAK
jgi:hypothetical protein